MKTNTIKIDHGRNPWPNLFTSEQYRRLVANGEKSLKCPSFEARPVVKLFTPDAAATWLLSDIAP